MGKYTIYQRPEHKRRREVHPIWRGIGCLLIIIVPLISYAGAVLLVNYGLSQGWPIPAEWLGYIKFPVWVWQIPFLASIARPMANFSHPLAILAFFVVVLILLTGLVSTVYAFIYRGLGPPRYTTLDAPPSAHKPKQYKR